MDTVLIVYGSGTGCTAGVAQRMGDVIAKRGVSVEVVSATEAPDAAGYGAVIVGSGVRAGSWHKSAKEWLVRNAEALSDIPLALFTVCLTPAQDAGKVDEVRAYTDPLLAETGVKPVDVGVFAGWNEPREFSFVERMVLKLLKAPEGDFRDWPVIEAWAERTADALVSGDHV